MAGNDGSFVASNGKRYTRGPNGELIPVEAESGSGYAGGYTPGVNGDPASGRSTADGSGGPVVKNEEGYVVSGGGWNAEQWKQYYAILNKPGVTGAEIQSAYMSRPDVAAQQAAQAGGLPQASAGYNYEYGAPNLINPATGQKYQQGEYAEQRAGEAFGVAGQQSGRAAPQADYSMAAGDLNSARGAALGGIQRLNQAYDVNADQTRLGQHLAAAALGQGPSVAELSMQRAAAQEQQRSLAIAAGGTGPGANAALINAQNRNAISSGVLQQNVGVQRAAEQVQARTELANLLNQQRGSTLGESGMYGNLGGLAANIGQVSGAQQFSNAQLKAGQNALNQQGEQYFYGQGADWIKGQANLNATKAANWNNYTIGQTSNANQAAATQQAHDDSILGATISGAGTALATVAIPFTGGATAPAAVAGGVNTAKEIKNATGSSDERKKTAIRPAGPEVSQAYRAIADANAQADYLNGAPVVYASDVENKTGIVPAGDETAAAYRGIAEANRQAGEIRGADVRYPTEVSYEGPARANDQARQIREARVEYPTPKSPFEDVSANSYYYKDPNAPGAEPGRQFGGMAQEFEKTPAGRSVVRTMPDGSKGLDTGRVALLNASETGQQRRQLDAHEARLGAVEAATGKGALPAAKSAAQAAQAAAPKAAVQKSPAAPAVPVEQQTAALRASNDRKERMLKQISSGMAGIQRSLTRPVSYPTVQAPPSSVVAYQPQAQAMQLPQQNYYGY